jgi:hypothetical protein
VRSGNSDNDYIVFRISQGDNVLIIGRNNNGTWIQIDVGVIGWVNSQYVDTSGNISSLLVVDNIVPIPTASIRLRFECPGARGPSFDIGERFVVPDGDGPSSVLSEPNREPRLGQVAEGDGGTILGGPICTAGQDGNLVIWYVLTDSRLEGYMSEGYGHSSVPWISPWE